ncbi:MAG: secondary thiamine-phosphate synthase enzyme YjbQ [Methanobacteriaceae archaeon]|jgi:secondary thiamine-phosphate synthase enzyme|nr:secondary thiamine-phosphate synthase enzyme YjbQ [Methanobacteriaceae archaeon]
MFVKTLNISTKNQFEIIDISQEINNFLNILKIDIGVVNVFSKHSTSAISINENEKGLLKDLEIFLNEFILENNNYFHDKIDDNAHSHLKSFFLKNSETIPISNNQMNLGIWQSVFFIEFDGPRSSREIILTVFGK